MLWPTWMDDLKAKSEDMGGQTLAQHTWDVLSRMADLRRLHPHLVVHLSERIWQQAFWAAFLHDFGKAAAGFQEVLRGTDDSRAEQWRTRKHRHEVLSLGFVDWVFPRGHTDRDVILAMVGFHHKDAGYLFNQYGGDVPFNKHPSAESIKMMLGELADNISLEVRGQLWRWLTECAQEWAQALSISLDPQEIVPLEQARTTELDKSIAHALRDLHTLYTTSDQHMIQKLLILRGMIFTADHSASAGLESFPEMPLTAAIAARTLKGHVPREHQSKTAQCPIGSAILVAPTGSGKTEAAILWAAHQLEQRWASRLFYTLPYQASMNAMYARLARDVLGYTEQDLKSGQIDTLTIRHSRALLKLYQDMMVLDEADSRQATQQAKWLRNKADLNAYPMQVFSPYQMLKAAYSLKGFESLLLDYVDGLFIFDEIHAYEPKRLALIIELMRWLRENFGARFLVMTATLPPMLQRKLEDALTPQVIYANADEFVRSRRHRVEIRDGSLSESILPQIQSDWSHGKKVLVCLNRVADAQQVYLHLRDGLGLRPDEDIVLLHGRFNGFDRARKEATLLQRAGVGNNDSRPFVCIATQVVEVSLNVDFDTLYTDPAPLEALLQRFGRVNRGRAVQDILPVHVFRQPSAQGDKPYLPYEQRLVEDSLRVLESYCDGRTIDESLVTTMLGEIYSGQTLDEWENAYETSRSAFVRDILGAMQPFTSADDALKHTFYKLFDGIEVLPVSLLDAYYDARDSRGYLEASQYLVNISYQTYGEFNRYGRIIYAKELENEYADHINIEYSEEFGLDIEQARQAHKAASQQTIEDSGE